MRWKVHSLEVEVPPQLLDSAGIDFARFPTELL